MGLVELMGRRLQLQGRVQLSLAQGALTLQDKVTKQCIPDPFIAQALWLPFVLLRVLSPAFHKTYKAFF